MQDLVLGEGGRGAVISREVLLFYYCTRHTNYWVGITFIASDLESHGPCLSFHSKVKKNISPAACVWMGIGAINQIVF